MPVPESIIKINEYVWEIPVTYKKGMQVPVRIYASKKLLEEMDDGVFEQITNVACMPGAQKYVFCMPDAHWGYGTPIGGVVAFDAETGLISPGLVGFDINCGVRLVTTNLTFEELQPKLKELVDTLFKSVPVGVGCKGFVKLDKKQFKEVMVNGAKWCVDNGYGWKEDLEVTEENGCIKGADPSKVSERAISRGMDQLGTLGSGNHYLEIQVVKKEKIFDKNIAKIFGITKENQICIMVHCGSRGFGHQVASDYLKVFEEAMKKYNITVNDRELACAPYKSPEGQDYYKAMACAANMAFANRQVILHRIRECFSKVFGKSAEELGMHQVYDVAHNIIKLEEHDVDGKKKLLAVHRKGATRSYGPGFKELPEKYKKVGQPVIIGGSMETGSYLLVGTEKAAETFNSTAHGSGRTMSRTKAKHEVIGEKLQQEMEARGIYVKSVSYAGLAEEAGIAYKDINEVIDTIDKAGISKRIVGLTPIGNVKGLTSFNILSLFFVLLTVLFLFLGI